MALHQQSYRSQRDADRLSNMNKLLLVVCALVGVMFGQEPPKMMTRVVVTFHSPDVAEGSFAAKPKVFYRAADRYCRIEEAADPEKGVHDLMIVNEPDYWAINLFTKTAQHGTDTGPTFNCHLPIFASGNPQSLDEETKEIRQLEFGREREFFEGKGAVPEPGPVLFKHETTVYKTQVGTTSLSLFLAKSPELPGLPIAVSLKRGDKNETILYSQYARTEFDPKLFAQPADVKVEGSSHEIAAC